MRVDLEKYENWDVDTIESVDDFDLNIEEISLFFREINQKGLNDGYIWFYGAWVTDVRMNLKKKFISLKYKNGSRFIIDSDENFIAYISKDNKKQNREDFYIQLNIDIWIMSLQILCEPRVFFSKQNPLKN